MTTPQADALRLLDEMDAAACGLGAPDRHMQSVAAYDAASAQLRALLSSNGSVYTTRIIMHAAGLSTLSVPESMKGKLVEVRVIEEPAK